MNTWSMEILNVGAGDMKLTFNKDDPAELIRAKRVIRDMIRRGFSLLIKEGDAWVRAQDFDEKTGEYLIADFAPEEAEPVAQPQVADPRGLNPRLKDGPEELTEIQLPGEVQRLVDDGTATFQPEAEKPTKKGNGRRTRWSERRVKMEDAKVTAVGRSAGG